MLLACDATCTVPCPLNPYEESEPPLEFVLPPELNPSDSRSCAHTLLDEESEPDVFEKPVSVCDVFPLDVLSKLGNEKLPPEASCPVGGQLGSRLLSLVDVSEVLEALVDVAVG